MAPRNGLAPPLLGRRRAGERVVKSFYTPFGRIEPAAEIGSLATDGRPSSKRAALAFEQDLVAAAVSTSLVPICASSLPACRHTGTPIRDLRLRLIDAQLHTARCYLP